MIDPSSMAGILGWCQNPETIKSGRKLCCMLLESGNSVSAAQVVAMLTQTEVDPADPAFSHPTKFIGPCYSKEEAEKCAIQRLCPMNHLLHHVADDRSHRHHKGSLSRSRVALHILPRQNYMKFWLHDRIRYAHRLTCMM